MSSSAAPLRNLKTPLKNLRQATRQNHSGIGKVKNPPDMNVAVSIREHQKPQRTLAPSSGTRTAIEDDMTTTNTAPTIITITTGKRTWNLRVLEKKGKTWIVESVRKDRKAGKQYTLNVWTKQLAGVRKTREGGERLYHWAVSTLNGKSRWDWRRPLAKLALAA